MRFPLSLSPGIRLSPGLSHKPASENLLGPGAAGQQSLCLAETGYYLRVTLLKPRVWDEDPPSHKDVVKLGSSDPSGCALLEPARQVGLSVTAASVQGKWGGGVEVGAPRVITTPTPYGTLVLES
jgi:hypothetical protein